MLSPNPVTEILTVGFEQPISGLLEIITSSGAVIQSAILNETSGEKILTNKLASGLYFLRISVIGQPIQILKFIVAH